MLAFEAMSKIPYQTVILYILMIFKGEVLIRNENRYVKFNI
jgi:hypothetical protein